MILLFLFLGVMEDLFFVDIDEDLGDIRFGEDCEVWIFLGMWEFGFVLILGLLLVCIGKDILFDIEEDRFVKV